MPLILSLPGAVALIAYLVLAWRFGALWRGHVPPFADHPLREQGVVGGVLAFHGLALALPGIGLLNMGVGEAVNDRKKVESAAKDLSMIAGQRAVITRARKSIATYKVRDDMPIGAKVTLRGDRMYEFVDRLVTIALPRVKDFRGLNPKSFDGRGNYAMGVKEQIIFPEIEYDKIDAVRGMNISITTTAKNDDEAKALLNAFSFPFRN